MKQNQSFGCCCSFHWINNNPKFTLVPQVLHLKKSCLFKRYETESLTTYGCRKTTTLDTGTRLLTSVSCNYSVISHLALHFSSFLSTSVFVQCKKCAEATRPKCHYTSALNHLNARLYEATHRIPVRYNEEIFKHHELLQGTFNIFN